MFVYEFVGVLGFGVGGKMPLSAPQAKFLAVTTLYTHPARAPPFLLSARRRSLRCTFVPTLSAALGWGLFVWRGKSK